MRNRRSVGITAAAPMPMDSFESRTHGPTDPVAPESYFRSQSNPNIDWEGLVPANPDNPRYTAQTPNGSASNEGNGYNQPQYNWHPQATGKRWSPPVNWSKHGGNRTGE
jgi:hypothetical protein